jgi:prolyl-tRNA editing enzyme YbaK/EbsC (Cys-tRNA(Pro) deacylase)
MGFKLDVLELPASTRTAEEAARAIGCQVGQIAKSLIFKTERTHHPVLIIASGQNRVDEGIFTGYLGEKLEMADANYVKEQTGYVIGGVPPVGLLRPMKTFIDEYLLQYGEIWAAAGTPHAIFRLTPEELVQMTSGKVLGLSTGA